MMLSPLTETLSALGADGQRCRRCRSGKWLRTESELAQRLDQHPLRAAKRADRPQAAVADAVVDRAARHVEQLRRLVDRYAAPEPRLVGRRFHFLIGHLEH